MQIGINNFNQPQHNQPNFQARKVLSIKTLKDEIVDIYKLDCHNPKDRAFVQRCYEAILDFGEKGKALIHREGNIYPENSQAGYSKYTKEVRENLNPQKGYADAFKQFLAPRHFRSRYADTKGMQFNFWVAVNENAEIAGIAANTTVDNGSYSIYKYSNVDSFIINSDSKSAADGIRLCMLNDLFDGVEKYQQELKDFLSRTSQSLNLAKICDARFVFKSYPLTSRTFFKITKNPESKYGFIEFEKFKKVMSKIQQRNSHSEITKVKDKTDYDMSEILEIDSDY